MYLYVYIYIYTYVYICIYVCDRPLAGFKAAANPMSSPDELAFRLDGVPRFTRRPATGLLLPLCTQYGCSLP